MIAVSKVSQEQARALVQGCFFDLIKQTESYGGYVPATCEPDLEIREQKGMSGERILWLQEQLADHKFDGPVLMQGRAALERHGFELEELAPTIRLDIMSGVARALIEQQRLFQLRINDRLTPFVPVDPLFASPEETLEAPAFCTDQPNSAKGPSIQDAIATYLKAGRAKWVLKTYQARTWQLRFFVEHVGEGMPLVSIRPDHVRTFRDAVRTLHRFHGKKVGYSFAARQTENSDHHIADKTAAIIFEPVKAFFRWCKSEEGLIDSNPAEDIRLVAAKKVKGRKARRPFGTCELATLFSAPIYSGCRSIHRRYNPGNQIISDAKYWVPVLGFYTGARLGELIQLHVRDVYLDGPIPYLSINEDNLPDADPSSRKHVKSEAGVRFVPLHPDLIELGFSDFVKRKSRKKGKGSVRLFEEFSYGSDGQASTVFSKFFARFMDSVERTDPALVFHSFRHNAEDAFRDALAPQYVIDRIIGHSDGSASAGYGEGIDLETAYGAVKAMKLKIRLPELLGSEKPLQLASLANR